MRTRNKAFLSCVVVSALGLLGTPSATATGGGCSWTVDVDKACPVDNLSQPHCVDSGPYTGIRYTVGGSRADHVATLVTANNDVVVPMNPAQVFPPCKGDPATKLGAYSCHEKAVKINGVPSTGGDFWIIVEGRKQPVPTSLVLKNGGCKKSYLVDGLGFDRSPFQVTQKTETVKFKDCSVDFNYDALTGQLLSAALAEGSEDCNFYEADVSALELNLDLPGVGDLGIGQFGEGYISSGEDSCTTRVIGGRVYTWGKPCPN